MRPQFGVSSDGVKLSGFALLFLLARPRMYAADQQEGSGGSEHEVITGDQAAAIPDELRAIRERDSCI